MSSQIKKNRKEEEKNQQITLIVQQVHYLLSSVAFQT